MKLYTDNIIEEHTSVKRAFHCFHGCHLHPFYILGSARCSSGICSFRFNNVGHVINVLKITCCLPFHKPANIFGQIAATFLIRNFEHLALVYPIESIFKINTVCVSDFELHPAYVSGKPTGLKYDFKTKYRHTRIEDGLTVVKGSFEALYYNVKLFKLGKEQSADVFSFVVSFVNHRVSY